MFGSLAGMMIARRMSEADKIDIHASKDDFLFRQAGNETFNNLATYSFHLCGTVH